ncbi:MAG: hypothetical protein L6R40_005118 [Gallowayella cf. fulva]|nr:MAG: hypothetical protein L6R40_005118 [Xanthomendoza cf. fulva]
MRTSWYNDTVAFRPISKNGTLNLNGPVLWPSTDNQSFFASGGGRSFFAQVIDPPDVASWRFTTDENGGETWVIFKPVDDSIFYTLTQPDGASGATVHDTGCIFGGQESALTGNNISIVQRANTGHGVVQHHIRSLLIPRPFWSVTEKIEYGSIVHDLLPISSHVDLPKSGLTKDGYNPPPFNNITIYEPTGKTWHSQTATGHVFVLSLPAFAWSKVDYQALHPRIRHTCHVLGNRQMISIGGHDPANVYNDTTANRNPFTQGLGRFHLTSIRWTDGYGANAEAIRDPAVVKAWYSANGTSPRTWDDPSMQRLFRGAIAGGTVSGFVALTLTIGLIFWWLRRRRRDGDSRVEYAKPELSRSSPAHLKSELSAKETPYEIPGKPLSS